MSRTCTRCQQTVPDGDLLCGCQVVTDPSADVIALLREMEEQVSLGHKKFCAGIHEDGEEEWIPWEDTFRVLLTAYAQVTAERDAKEAQYAEAVKSGVELATELATLRADLAAQVDGMTYTTMQTEADEFYGREGWSFVSRDEVLTLLRGPHAD